MVRYLTLLQDALLVFESVERWRQVVASGPPIQLHETYVVGDIKETPLQNALGGMCYILRHRIWIVYLDNTSAEVKTVVVH
ncbi:MAG: hypothetical protein WBF33_28475 [Candidatus Nitrosopolaris sp.]